MKKTVPLVLALVGLLIVTAFGFWYIRHNGTTENELMDDLRAEDLEALRKEATIGYVGCSNTMQTVASYWFAGGRKFWIFDEDRIHQYDSGAVTEWAKNLDKGNKFWKTFDRQLQDHPRTTAVFWQLCIREEDPTTYEETLMVLNMIREKIPGVTVYVSPLPPYTKGVCKLTGTVGIEKAAALAKELDVRHEDVVPGPVLGPMTPDITDQDGCHLNIEGTKTLGRQMKAFFDTVQ